MSFTGNAVTGVGALTASGKISGGTLDVAGATTLKNDVSLGDDDANTLTVTATIAGALSFEGTKVDDFETTLSIVDPTADRTINVPDADAVRLCLLRHV